jgi:spore coat-associated protein N
MGISMKSTSGKILASVALVGTAAAVAGMGTYGAFTDSTTTADQQVTAGTVVIELGGTVNTLSTPITGLLPGDSVERYATLSNTGSSDFGNVTLTTKLAAGATANALTTDVTNGLRLTVETCSTAWTVRPSEVDTCTGSKTVLADSAILAADARVLTNLASVAAQASDHLKITTSLPSSADNTFQGLTSTVDFTFNASQRAGTVK